MKKILIVLITIMLYSCGSGISNNTDTSSTGGEEKNTNETFADGQGPIDFVELENQPNY